MATQSESQLKLLIVGEHQSATESLDAVSKALNSITETVSSLVSRMSEATKTFTDFGRGVAEVKDALASTSGSLSRLGSNMGKQAQSVSKASGDIVKSMGDVTKSIQETAATDSTSLRSLADAQNAIAMASYEAAQKIKAETDAQRANTEATRANTSAVRQHKHDMMLDLIAVQMIGGAITAVGLKGAELFVGAIKSAMNFQAMMSRVGAALKTTGGDTAQNIQNLSQLAMQLDQTSLFSMNDIGDMMQALAKQGLTYQQIYGGAAKATITLAQATDTSLTSTGTVVTDMMHEFNLSGSQLTPVINGISGAMHMANISMVDYYNSAKYVGPIASQLGLNFTDLSQAIGLLAQHGIKGSQAGTSLRRMLMDLQPSTKAATAEFKQLGLITAQGTNLFYNQNGTLKNMNQIISILHSHMQGLTKAQQESALRTMFGVYSLSAMEVVANTTAQSWNNLTKSMSNTTADKVAAEKMHNLQGDLKMFTSTLQTLGTQMATYLLPTVDNIVKGLQALAGWFKSLSPAVQHTIFAIIGAGSGLLLFTGAMLTARATMVFMSGGFRMIGQDLMRLTTPFRALSKIAGVDFVGAFSKVGSLLRVVMVEPWIKGFGLLRNAMKAETWTALGNSFVGVFTKMKAGVTTAVTTMVETSVTKLGAFKTFMTGLTFEKVSSGFVIGMKNMGAGLLSFGKGLLTFMTGPWGLLLLAVSIGVGLIISHWKQIETWAKNIFQLHLWQILQDLSTRWHMAWLDIKEVTIIAFDAVRSVVQSVWNYVGPTIMSGIAAVSSWWRSHFSEIQEVAHVVFTVFKVYIGALLLPAFLVIKMALGALQKSWTDIWHLIRDVLKTVFDAIVTIVRVAWSLLSGIIGVGLDLLTGHWGKAWTDLKNMVINIWNALRDGVGKIAQDLGNVVMDAVHALIDGVVGAFSGLVNTVKGIWNSIVSIFKGPLPSPSVPNVSVPTGSSSSNVMAKMNHYATGGVALSKQVALVAENEPEAIIPLSLLNQQGTKVSLPGGLSRSNGIGGGGVNIQNINIVVPNGDANAISKQVKIQLQRHLG